MMPAQPLHAPVVKLASTSVPAPIRRLFTEAELAEPPTTVCDLHLDTEHGHGAEKVLLAFTAGRADVNLFQLLSPALQRTEGVRYEELIEPPREHGDATGARPPNEHLLSAEPDHPWWCPDQLGPGRRFSFSTAAFDFVEVIITDLEPTVFIRAVR